MAQLQQRTGDSTASRYEVIPLQQINPGFRDTDDEVSDDEAEEFYRNHPGLARSRHSSSHLYRQSDLNEGGPAKDVLSMLPSRALSFKADAIEEPTFQSGSMRYRSIREAKLRRRKSLHNSLFRGGVSDDVVQDIVSSPEESTIGARSELLREIPTSLRQKLSIREKIETLDRKKMKKPSWSKRTKYSISMAFRHFKMKLATILYLLHFWRSHLKIVEGHFGTGVTSYFIFLRFLFLLNIPLVLLSISFIVIPQLLYRLQKDAVGNSENPAFTGTELLTGSGSFENTVLFYGHYINGTVNLLVVEGNDTTDLLTLGPSYNMQYAYLLTCVGYYLLCLILIGHMTARSYRRNYVNTSSSVQEHFIVKVLCAWNYTTVSKNAANLSQKFIYKEFREYLSATKKSGLRRRTCSQWCALILVRIAANVAVLTLIAGSGYLIWYISVTQSLKTDLRLLRELAMPLCISAFNIVTPVAFSMIGAIEMYGTPRVALYLALIRTMLMKGTTLGVLIYIWFVTLNCHYKDIPGVLIERSTNYQDTQCIPCWETYMGQEIYRLVIVDFFASIIMVFFTEFGRRLLSDYCCKFLGKPEFDIGRNTLDLVYSQALCWLGLFYSPLLPLMQLIKLFIMFYTKRVSVMLNCAPAQKPWRAAQTNTVFLGFLFAAFLMMVASVALSIIVIKPSAVCGPFRGQDSMYAIVTTAVVDWEERYPFLAGLIRLFTSEGAIFGVIVTLVCILYYLRIMAKGRRELVDFLLLQIKLEGRDKNFLIKKYQQLHSSTFAKPAAELKNPYSRKRHNRAPLITIVVESEMGHRTSIVPHDGTERTGDGATPSSDSIAPFSETSGGVSSTSVTPASTPASVHAVSVSTPDSFQSRDDIAESSLMVEIPPPDYDSSEIQASD